MVVGANLAGLGTSETADLLGFFKHDHLNCWLLLLRLRLHFATPHQNQTRGNWEEAALKLKFNELQWSFIACSSSRQSLGKSCIETRPRGRSAPVGVFGGTLGFHVRIWLQFSGSKHRRQKSFECSLARNSVWEELVLIIPTCFTICINTLSIKHNHHLLGFSCHNCLL